MNGSPEQYSQLATDIELYTEQRQLQERLDEQAERWHETCELISAVGNHEAKGIVLLELWKRDTYLSQGQLNNAIKTSQGEEVGWRPDNGNGVFFSYCRQTFDPIGHVIKGKAVDNRGQLADAYKISERGVDVAVPAVGLLLDWSLRYPDISIQRVFGVTATTGVERATEHNLNMLVDLLTNPSSVGIGAFGFVGLSDTRITAAIKAIDRLSLHDLVKKDSQVENNTRRYEVLDTEYRGTRRLESLRMESQIFYEFLGMHQPGQEFTFQELVGYTEMRAGQLDLDINLPRARRYFNSVLANTTLGEKIRPLELYNNGYMTIVEVPEDKIEALQDLLNIVLAIQDQDSEAMAYGRQRAQEIIESPQLVAQLMLKALRFSARAGRSAEVTKAQLVSIVRAAEEPLDSTAINAEFKRITGRPLSDTTVYQYLLDLEAAGGIKRELMNNDATRQKQTEHYFVPRTDE